MNKWSVLLLSPGYGHDTIRSVVIEYVRGLGFDANVYDAPGYPVDPSVHSHSSCIEAISHHDIVLALVDEAAGGEFQIGAAPPEMIAWLTERAILRPGGGVASSPTILEVEVMVARALQKPTIVFTPKNVQAHVETIVSTLRSGGLRLEPRHGGAPDPRSLIDTSNWAELDAHYIVPAGRIKTFRQLVFLERLRREAPNFISYFDSSDHVNLTEHIRGRLAGIAIDLVQRQAKSVLDRIETKRSPLGLFSLSDLLSRNLILSPPFDVLSGGSIPGGTIFGAGSAQQGIAALLLSPDQSVLIIGDPGLGKTTTCLLIFRDVAQAAKSQVGGFAPLFGSWRDLLETPDDVDDVLRRLLAPRDREPWPRALDLPALRWIVILDGLDESPWGQRMLTDITESLGKRATVLFSCREHDFERRLESIKSPFRSILRLAPWNDSHVEAYMAALRAVGESNAADFIDRQVRLGQLPELFSVPLWLSMLAYLGRQPALATDTAFSSDYDLLRQCFEALSEDEVKRQGGKTTEAAQLRDLWKQGAFRLHRSRREGESLLVASFLEQIGLGEETPLGRSFLSLLDFEGDRILGFSHEVFHEYWLAEYLVDQILNEGTTSTEIAGIFGYQRSVVTNRLIRARVSRERIDKIAPLLREAFFAADTVTPQAEFIKNQLVYLLGRIDHSQGNKAFLRNIWGTSAQSQFVRHSAAFAAIMLGSAEIEAEYYALLSTSSDDDSINRGYHLYYYKDIDIRENEVPARDKEMADANATLRQLFRRLGRTEERHRNLRRIELLTVRRFLETGRSVPVDIVEPGRVLDRVIVEAENHPFGQEFVAGVSEEARKIHELIRAKRP